ncbi:MAG: hypothetical protein ABIM36_02895 [candidate division WOR-3 bacterium]
MKMCYRCGKSIKESERFCKFCGFYFPLLDIERKKLVVIHVDIEGFTRISHLLEPENIDEILKSIFGSLIFILESNGVFINQFYGDEIVGLLGLSGVKENLLEKALEIESKVHYFFKNYKTNENIIPKVKISMEYGELFLTLHKTDGSSYLLICGKPEERAKEGLKFIKGGETAIGINFLNALENKIKVLPATEKRKDIFIIERT